MARLVVVPSDVEIHIAVNQEEFKTLTHGLLRISNIKGYSRREQAQELYQFFMQYQEEGTNASEDSSPDDTA